MLDSQSKLGCIAYSKAGRDKGNIFLIVGILDEEYVYISDGEIRKFHKPKKKKLKHLNIIDYVSDDIKNMILCDKNVNDSQIKEFLQSHKDIEEV